MQYAETEPYILDRPQMKPKTTSIQTQRTSYLVSTQRGLVGSQQSSNQARASFNLHESYQEDILHIQAGDSGKNSTKKLYHATTLSPNYTGGDGQSIQGNIQQNNAPKKAIGKQNAPQKKKMWQLQQQLPPKQLGVNLVNLNLNFNNNPSGQLPPTYPLIKNQENTYNLNDNPANIKKKKLLQSQQEPSNNQMKVPQLNYNPNRLQKIQNILPQKSQPHQNFEDGPSKGYLIDQFQSSSRQSGIDLNTSSSILANSTNLTNKNQLQQIQKQSQLALYQVQDIIPIHEEYASMAKSESPTQRMSNIIQCNHKQKSIKETPSFNQRSFNSNSLYNSEIRNSKLDSTQLDPTLTPKERMERMIKNLENSATKVLQLQNKQKGGCLEMNRRNGAEQNVKDILKQRQVSQEQYDDTTLYNQSTTQYNQQTNVPPQKNKQTQQAYKSAYPQDTHKNNFYNGIRNEPSSHQFIALKLPQGEDDRLKQSINGGGMIQTISQIIELDFEQSNETIRNSFTFPKNSLMQQNRRQVSESEPREFDSNNTMEDNLKQFGVNMQQLSLQKKDLLNYKNFRTLQNQTTIEGQLGYDANVQNMESAVTMPLQENKKTNRKIINAIPQFKQDPLSNKSQSGIAVSASIPSRKSVQAIQNGLMTQQQKDKLQKNEKDNQLILKIKIFLDFQRIINFSNNMTMQTTVTNGVKLYKAYITKGNNGVLIRAALKNRWWWSLSETSEDYENINFLWTQWRKPQFFKMIKSRSELSVNQVKDDEETNNEIESNEIGNQPSTNDSSGSNNQLGEQQSNNAKENVQMTNSEGIDSAENTLQDQVEEQKVVNEISSPLINERSGYNEASPSKNLQDYIVKQSCVSKKQSQSSPLGRKLSQQIKLDDPYAKIAALVNEKDLGLIKQYVKGQKNRKQAGNSVMPPPVFNREEYEQGIEKEYEKMRQSATAPTPIYIYKNPVKQKMHNHMEFNFHLANKKALYYNMKTYYNITNQNVFDHLPVTFHIQNGLNDTEFTNFTNYYNTFEAENPKRKNVWIIKPGESSNRGNGIQVAGDLNTVRDIIKVKESHQNGFKKTYIIQKYLDRPFLYNKRKFDIRCFMLMTNYNNTMKVYWYTDGYIRTSTKEFTLKNLENRMIHLTNEAVQKRGDDFGKYENGNKLSYAEFQKYIDATYPKDNLNFMQQIYPQMKKLAYDSVCSVFTKIDKKKRNFSFELFGLDFMIDDAFRTWLIEINTNPSLTIAAPLMSRLLPALIDNVLKIAIDPIYPPPSFPKSKKHLIPEQIYENNKFELLFDSDVDGQRISKLYSNISKKSNILRFTASQNNSKYFIKIVDEELEEDCKNEEVYDDDDVDVEEEDENEEEGC